MSPERLIECGVPQGFILGPLLFLLYINDLPECLRITRPRLFADDTNLTASSHSGMVMTEWSIGGKKLWKSLFGIILEKISIQMLIVLYQLWKRPSPVRLLV